MVSKSPNLTGVIPFPNGLNVRNLGTDLAPILGPSIGQDADGKSSKRKPHKW